MKLLTLAILLVTVFCLEGAIVKRETAAEENSQAQDLTAFLKEALTNIFTSGEPFQERIEYIKQRAQSFSTQAQAHVTPLVDKMRELANQLIQSAKS